MANHPITPNFRTIIFNSHATFFFFQIDLTVVAIHRDAFDFSLFALFSENLQLDLLPSREICGSQGQERIINGVGTTIGEFTWMALLGYETRNILSTLFIFSIL